MLTLCLLGLGMVAVGFVVSYSVSVNGGGLSNANNVTRSGDGPILLDAITLPAGKAGTLSTRTDNDTGEATLGVSHGITTGQIVDVYWAGGMRYGMTVGTVDGTAVPLDGGAGDNLPTEDAPIVVTVQVIANITIDGDEVALLSVKSSVANSSSTAVGSIDFQDASSASIEHVDLEANVTQVWDIEGGAANPFTGNPITHLHASCGSATESMTLTIIGVQDATP